MEVPDQEKREFTLPLPFCSIWTPMDWLMSTHISEGKSALLSLLHQMLISSGNTLIDTSRSDVLPAIWGSLRPVRLTYNINHHTHSSFSGQFMDTH